MIVSAIGLIVLIAAYPVGAIGGRVSIARFARAVAPAQAVAISTQSSLASLPAMLRASEQLGAPAAVPRASCCRSRWPSSARPARR